MPSPKFLGRQFADKLVGIAKQQLEDGLAFKLPRMEEVRKNEDAYFNKTPRTLKRRMNVPLPIMSGFIDTLISKVDEPPAITFGPTELADTMKARKVTAMWQVDSSPTRGMWAIKDIVGKKLAAFSGREIKEIFSESDPNYKNHLEIVDPFDFVCEPNGGWHLENHLFLGKVNVVRTKADLQEGVEKGWYERNQVARLINSTMQLTDKELDESKLREDRLRALGMNLRAHSKIGDSMYSFAVWGMVFEGERYYLMFDVKSGIWIRAHKLDDVFKRRSDEPQLWPWVSWATHYDAWNFWSKAPADDVRPIHDSMRVIFNEGLMNLRRRNWNMRAIDADIFPNPAELEWREDGIVMSTAGLRGKKMADGIYEFQPPDTTNITVNLMEFMNSFLGQKTGITAETQGVADADQKVGIFFGQLQQVADRLGLYNKFYKQAWAELGLRYMRGLRQHATEGMMVKSIGSAGGGWEEFIKEDANPISDFDIQIAGGSAEVQLNEIKKKQRADALTALSANVAVAQRLNGTWLIKETLRNGGYEEQEIKVALDTKNEADQDILAEADQAVQDIENGKRPKKNRGATADFMQYILDYADDNVPDNAPEKYNAMIAYAQSHVQTAARNAARKAAMIAGAEMAPSVPKLPGMPGEETSAIEAGSIATELAPESIPRVTNRGTLPAESVVA